MTTQIVVALLVLVGIACLMLAVARSPRRCAGIVIRRSSAGVNKRQCHRLALPDRIYCKVHLSRMNGDDHAD